MSILLNDFEEPVWKSSFRARGIGCDSFTPPRTRQCTVHNHCVEGALGVLKDSTLLISSSCVTELPGSADSRRTRSDDTFSCGLCLQMTRQHQFDKKIEVTQKEHKKSIGRAYQKRCDDVARQSCRILIYDSGRIPASINIDICAQTERQTIVRRCRAFLMPQGQAASMP